MLLIYPHTHLAEGSLRLLIMVDPQLKGGNLGSWMATKDPSLNTAENDFPIEI